MGWELSLAVQKYGPEAASQRSVLRILTDYARSIVAWPAVETIAAEAHLSVRTIQTALRGLERDGWITTRLGGGRKRPSVYTLTDKTRQLRPPSTAETRSKTPQELHPFDPETPQDLHRLAQTQQELHPFGEFIEHNQRLNDVETPQDLHLSSSSPAETPQDLHPFSAGNGAESAPEPVKEEKRVSRDPTVTLHTEKEVSLRAIFPELPLGDIRSSAPCRHARRFEDFWNAYPHRNSTKTGKAPALKRYQMAVKRGVAEETMIAGAWAAHRHPDVKRGYARDPATWLNQEGWEDEVDSPNGGGGEWTNMGWIPHRGH